MNKLVRSTYVPFRILYFPYCLGQQISIIIYCKDFSEVSEHTLIIIMLAKISFWPVNL